MQEAPLISASQITLFTECQRKWGFKYLQRVEVPPHPSAVLGTEVHAHQLGPWLTEGREFDYTKPSGEIALALKHLLPAPKTPGMVLERHFVIPSPGGKFSYQGYIDLYAPDATCVPGLERDPFGVVPLVGDFKTTSNLDYAKTEETLLTDVQAMLYATAVMFEDNADEVYLSWFYTRTRKPHRALRVAARVSGSHVVEQFQKIDEVGARVAATRLANPNVDELPPNPRMCDAYGGCPFRHICNLSPVVHAAGVNKEAVLDAKANSFVELLRKKQQGAVATHPTVAGNPHPMAARVDIPADPTPVVHPSLAPPVAPTVLPAWLTAPVAPKAGPAINPPESALPPAPPVNVAPAAAAPTEAPAKRTRRTKEQMAADAAALAPIQQSVPYVATVVNTEVAQSFFDDFPRAEFATFLRAWASRMEGGQ